MLKKIIFFIACMLCLTMGAVLSPPATWLTYFINMHIRNSIIVADTKGTIWNGSAVIAQKNKNGEAIAALPGRIAWEMSSKFPLGGLYLKITNDLILDQPVILKYTKNNIKVETSKLNLPSDYLTSFGAPFNTIKPTGDIAVSWDEMIIIIDKSIPKIYGKIVVDLKNIATNLSPIKPLGHYSAEIDLNGEDGEISLRTVTGPLKLTGEGVIIDGLVRFSGYAKTENNKEELRNFMNLLGQWKNIGGDEAVALEF